MLVRMCARLRDVRGLVEGVDLVDDRERPRRHARARLRVDAAEGGVDRAGGIVDLHGDLRRIQPVPLEVAVDHLVVLGPQRSAAVLGRTRRSGRGGRGGRRARRVAVIRVGAGVNHRQPLAAADEVHERLAAGGRGLRAGGVVEVGAGGAGEEDRVVLLQVLGGDDGGIVGDDGRPRARLLAHRLDGPGRERDRRVDEAGGLGQHQHAARLLGRGRRGVGQRRHHLHEVGHAGHLRLRARRTLRTSLRRRCLRGGGRGGGGLGREHGDGGRAARAQRQHQERRGSSVHDGHVYRTCAPVSAADA